ncbi:MAG TPA: phage major capsid protein, partial [Pyrinomonadaceae bacterium]
MALASHVPATWDTILSTTMHNYRKSLTDNIFGSRVLLEYLMSNGRVRTIDGGISIVEPLLLGSGEANSYGPWDQIQVNPVGGITAAQFPWKQLYATIIISGLEEAQNNGKEQAISLIEAKVMQAEETLKNILSAMLWGTRGGAAKPTDFDSFVTLIDATSAAGGITPAAAPAIENRWRSPTLNATTMVGTDSQGNTIPAGSLPAAGPNLDGAELEKTMRRMFNLASDGGADHVDAIFTGSDGFEAYEASLTPQVRYTDTSKANLGFQNLMFKQVPLFWDPDAPVGV